MKKIITCLLLVCALCAAFCVPVQARSSTTYNYTISVDGDWIRTQDAYVPGAVYLRNLELSAPEDIFIKDDILYVADTGNARVIAYNMTDGTCTVIGEGTLVSPCGIFVAEDNTVYIADKKAPAVFIYDVTGNLVQTISTPDSYLFGKTSVYAPKNVVVSSQGNIYVVGDGAHEGLMQFDFDGTFQGYFAANKRSLTLLEYIQELIYTDAQKAKSVSRIAQPIYNIDITSQDLIYSVTQAADKYAAGASSGAKSHNLVQLHNLGGNNILSKEESMHDEWNFIDIASGIYSNSYALTQTGLIYEYDSSGNLVFSFGGRAMSDDKNGLITDAAAIDVDKDGFIYVLDRERALVQIFVPTDFAVATQKAIYYLDTGNYDDSEETWNEVLKLNGMSRIAHLGLGKTFLHQQRYKEALEEFRIANDRKNYSTAYWELRSAWLDESVLWLLGGIILLTAGVIILRHIMKRRPQKPKPRLLTDVLYIGNMLRHPIDSLYYLNRGERGSLLSASIVYLLGLVVFMLDMLCRSFIFGFERLKNTSPFYMPIAYAVVLVLFILGNYMVSSINDGKGTVKQVYITTAYALSPYICITPFIVALTYVLTLNESFLISFPWTIVLIWLFVVLFITLSETHAYSFKATVKNLLLTLFFMLVCVVVIALVYIFWKQIIIFVGKIIGEVSYRVIE